MPRSPRSPAPPAPGATDAPAPLPACAAPASAPPQTARKIHIAKFRAKRVPVLITTDIAARGIDIPLIDNVINYDFPPKPELFVHR
jgi:superfamily II DNA/RNA helicase